jgi:hypothetical protein
MQGDRVTTEYYLQFADHYFRVLAESRSRFEEQQPRPRRDDYMAQNDGDDEYGDEGEGAGNGNEPSQQRDEPSADRTYQPRDDDQRRYSNEGANGNGNGNSYNDGRDDNRGDRNGNGNDRGDRRPRRDRDNRNDGGDGYAAAPAQPRNDDRNESRAASERPRDDRPREDRPREDRNRRPRRDREDYAPAPVAAEAGPPPPAPVQVQEDVVPPKVRRPRRPAAVEASGEVERIEVDRLPPAFSLTAPIADVANDAEAPAEKPRRRTRRPATDGTAVEI